MTEIHTTINTFANAVSLLSIFPASDRYEFTSKKVFRLKDWIPCACGKHMVHNGYNYARKKGFGKVRMGKQRCLRCGAEHQEDKSFWKGLLTKWEETVMSLLMVLRDSHVGWAAISTIMNFILPCSKDKARYLFNRRIELFEYPQQNYLIVNYDEQHPKRGRTQKFRLTLLNHETRIPLAEGLFDSKDETVIEAFLREHLDVDKEIVLITDCDRRYPAIFKRIWGNKVIHQKCLLHLNKLVVKEFGKNTTLEDEYNKYLILDIFYNRRKELKFLERKLKKQSRKHFASAKEQWDWVKKQKRLFRDYVRKLENQRRRDGKNLPQRPLWKAQQLFDRLWQQQQLFPRAAQARLQMIKEEWQALTAFYHIKGCPATNNALENYYSTSLKTHRKKQLRTDQGIINHMKLSALKRAEGFTKPKQTLLEIFGLIKLLVT